MLKDGISIEDMEKTMVEDFPKVIEDYSSDVRGASCLILAWMTPNDPVHICVGYAGTKLSVITVYRPDPSRWSTNFSQRE
jgi:hypothetical protein